MIDGMDCLLPVTAPRDGRTASARGVRPSRRLVSLPVRGAIFLSGRRGRERGRANWWAEELHFVRTAERLQQPPAGSATLRVASIR